MQAPEPADYQWVKAVRFLRLILGAEATNGALSGVPRPGFGVPFEGGEETSALVEAVYIKAQIAAGLCAYLAVRLRLRIFTRFCRREQEPGDEQLVILACGDVDSWAPSSAREQGGDIPLYFRTFLQLDVSEGRTQHESGSASFGISADFVL